MKKTKSKWDMQIHCKHYLQDFSGVCLNKLQPELFCVKNCKVFESREEPKVGVSNGING